MDSRRVLTAALLLLAAVPAASRGAGRISLVHRAAPSLPGDEPVVIEGHMLGASEVESAELFYRSAVTGGWRNLEFELVAGDHYRTVVPGGDVQPPTLEYYVVAIDFLEGRHAALGSAEQPVQVPVEASQTPVPTPRVFTPSPPLPTPASVPTPEPPPSPTPRQPATPTATAAQSPSFAEAGWIVRLERPALATTGAVTLADLLERVAGVHLRRELDGTWRLGFRGLDSHADVLLILDGQALNNPYDGTLLLSLPATAVERLEVHQGPATSLASRPALAGTVHVTTRAETGWQMQAGGGSYAAHTTSPNADRLGTYLARLSGGRANDALAWSAYTAVVASDGTQAEIRRDAYSATPLSSQAPGPIQDGNVSLIAGTQLRLDDSLPGVLTARGRYLFESRGGHVGVVDTYGPDARQIWHVGMVGVEHQLEITEGYTLSSRLGATLHQRDSRSQLAPKGFRLSDRNGDGQAELFPQGVSEELSMRSLGVDAEVEAAMRLVPEHNLRAGIWLGYGAAGEPEVKRNIDTLGAIREFGTLTNPPPLVRSLSRWSTALRVEDEWVVHPRVELALGFRFAYLSAVDRLELDKLFNLRLALLYRATDTVHLRILYGSTQRPPTLAERSDQLAATLPTTLAEDRFRGNPRLPSAARHHVEAGLDYRNRLSGLNLDGRASSHYIRAIDTIEAVPGAATDPQSGLTLITHRRAIDLAGVDLHGRLGSGETFVWMTTWWWRGFDWEKGGYTLLTAVPQLGATFGVHLEIEELGALDLFGRYDAERRNNTRTVVERLRSYRLPAQTSVHAAVRSRPLPAGLRLGLLVRNVFDTERADPVPRADIMPGQLPGEGLLILGTLELEVP